ncbi:MAG: universal stress protein [Candidatus Bathyarchaeota archaeon]
MSDYTVVVALANPANVGELVHLAALVAAEHNGELVATSVVHSLEEDGSASAPDPDAFSKAQNLVQRAQDAAQARGVQCQRRVAIAQHIHDGIANITEAQGADLLLMGMSEQLHPSLEASEIEFDRIVDAVAAHVPCNVLVAKFRDGIRLDRVLVPVADYTDLSMAREVIVPLYHQAGADIHFVAFTPSQHKLQQAHRELVQWLGEADLADCGEARIEVSDKPAEGIIQASETYDLVVIGTPPLHKLRLQLLGSVAEQVINNAHCSTLVMRAAQGG